MDDQVAFAVEADTPTVWKSVQLLLDDLPLLSGDLGQIWWSYLPMEHVGQVEVVKATASSTYGSGASNGVIHMRTVWPGAEPETVVSLFNGVYSDPDSTNWRWWDHSYSPISNGMNISHRQAFGKVDVVGGASFFADKTFLSGVMSNVREPTSSSVTAIRQHSNTAVAFKRSTSRWGGSSFGTISPPVPFCPWRGRRVKTVG